MGSIEAYGTMYSEIRNDIINETGSPISNHVECIDDYGITKISGLYDKAQLSQMQADVQDWHTTKDWNDDLYKGFDGANPEEGYLPRSEALSQAIVNPTLLAIITAALGEHPQLSTAKTFSVDPIEPYQRRASLWHHDGHWTADGLKTMLLLSDVPEEGQAMRYCPGTNKLEWPADSMEETTFTNDVESHFEQYICQGETGDVFVFNPFALHRAVRNQSVRRDVIIFDFQPGQKRNYGLPGLHPAIADSLTPYQQAVYRVGNETPPPTEVQDDIDSYRHRMRELAATVGTPIAYTGHLTSVDENITRQGSINQQVEPVDLSQFYIR
jgi:hypothetical protein